ncbi:integrase core domain-containing protein [Campylobacter jejuni]|uniref:Transposase n=1 Tax=Campylobacter jejuni TaxID=197 RepID=A0A5C4YDD4_CAMJU|nr:integrase core domain-containing protein [Campylobacter jejuni]SUW96980.1 Uncharacterised protein [Campylobacter jejuni subsp. doylei]EAH4640469.1 hypothetical protein [Campylobacter jejuni]EAH7148241.1 hypothetical protein [Campylobacter jejuni]EAH8791999.1 hypothetical protein [Campylobacter jejuni]EAI4847356.1 transposase [Campylobacter jejuni]
MQTDYLFRGIEGFANYYKDLLFINLKKFNQEMAKWLIAYNTILPHSALNYKTPLQYTLKKIVKSAKCYGRIQV